MAHTKLSTFLAILSTLSFTACVEPESTDEEFPEFEADDPTTAVFLVVGDLPARYGPAVAGTAEDLEG